MATETVVATRQRRTDNHFLVDIAPTTSMECPMSKDKDVTPKVLTADEVLRLAEMHATPIDFDQLISNGVLAKSGDWYKLLDMGKLPEHARIKIRKMRQSENGILVKFRKHKNILSRRCEK
jgi:hypothetical protein